MKYLLLLVLLNLTVTYGQEGIIKISHSTSNKEIIIKENKRIKIKTMEGEKIKGRFTIATDHSIIIKDREIELSDISAIKRNPLLVSILTSGFLIYTGLGTVGIALLAAALVDTSALWLIIPGAATAYVGMKAPNLLRNFKVENNWLVEIVPGGNRTIDLLDHGE